MTTSQDYYGILIYQQAKRVKLLLNAFFPHAIVIPIPSGFVLRKIAILLDTESWVTLQNAYEQWRLFPPDRLTLTGSREAGRMFSSASFPPANSSFSIIELESTGGLHYHSVAPAN